MGTVQLQPFHINNEGRSIVDVLDLAVNLNITAKVGSPPLHRGHAAEKSIRSSPELNINSPVYLQQDLLMIGPSSEPAAPLHVTSNTDALKETSLIDALDLAVDRKITAAAVLQLPMRRGEHFRSSPEMQIQAPIYSSVKSVPPVSVEFPEYPEAWSVGRRRSAWKRYKRFVWKSLVKMARRVCCCQTFEDLE